MSHQFSTIGQIATDPKLFSPAGGAEFCTFRLASTERRYDSAKQEWGDSLPNWFTVNTFRSLATHAKHSFKKGDRVVLTGRLRVRAWEADERRGTSVEIDADGIGHDVRFGTSAFTKTLGAEPREPVGASGAAGSGPSVAGASGAAAVGASVSAGAGAGAGAAGAAAAPEPPAQETPTAPEELPDALSDDGFTPRLATA